MFLLKKSVSLLVLVLSCHFAIAQEQEYWISELRADDYRLAIKIIAADSSLMSDYCGSDSVRLAIFPKFEFTSIDESDLPGAIKEEEGKAFLKDVKKAARNRDELLYKNMINEFYLKFDDLNSINNRPCVIVVFDRLHGPYLTAQVAYFANSFDWMDIIYRQGTYHYFVIDLRNPETYRVIEIHR